MNVVSRELQLAIACCRRAYASTRIDDDALGKIDWPRFLRLVRFHRVQGLVWKGLAAMRDTLPADVVAALAADAATIAADNLLAAVECARLKTEFVTAQVPLTFLKGLPLASLAYGGIQTKAAIDIDLLVPEQRLREAALLLQRAGYRPIAASLSAIEEWHRPGKESAWVHDETRQLVDLHTRVADHKALLPTLRAGSPACAVEIASGIVLPTLPEDELFAYLCVHGASSAWFRLKWLTDFAALLEKTPPSDIERLYQRSQQLGAGRAAGQALLLADRIYETLRASPDLRFELERDRVTRWLCTAAVRQLAEQPEPVEPTSRALGTLMIHVTQLGLKPGLRFVISESIRQVRAALRRPAANAVP